MSTREEWARAYARQGQADFLTWRNLESHKAVPECHKLLFIQMACEKLCKAHLCQQGADPATLQSSHAYTTHTLPLILREQAIASGMKGKSEATMRRTAKHLAQEIELLAPAVKRGGQRPDNCEYPWEDHQGGLHVPLDWNFAPSQLLLAPAGRTFLRLVTEALGRLVLRGNGGMPPLVTRPSERRGSDSSCWACRLTPCVGVS